MREFLYICTLIKKQTMATDDPLCKTIHIELIAKDIEIHPFAEIRGGVTNSYTKVKLSEVPMDKILGELIEEYGVDSLIELIHMLND